MTNESLFTALIQFQSQMTNITKDKQANTGRFAYRYADIAGVIESIRDPLAAAGLCYLQMLTNIDGKPALQTILAHASGEHIESTVPLTGGPLLDDPQKFGGVTTYFRRYALLGILGLATEDDDAQHAVQSPASARPVALPPAPRPTYQSPSSPRPEPSQRVAVDDDDMTWTDLWKLIRPFGIANQTQLEAILGHSIAEQSPNEVYRDYQAISTPDGLIAPPTQQGFKPQYPASEKQISYITALLLKKGMDARAWPGWAAYALNMDEAPAVENLDKNQASLVIEKLNATPDNPGMQAIIEASGGMMAHGR